MKKQIAVLLSLSMLAAFAGCSKKTEETKTKKTKKTSDTKVTETAPPTETETEPTETTEETTETEESTSSNATQSPIKEYPISPDFKITDDLPEVDYEITSSFRCFGGRVGSDMNTVGYIKKDIDLIQFDQSAVSQYEQLWNTIEATHTNLSNNYDKVYDDQFSAFKDSLGNGQYTTNINMEGKIEVFRADAQYFNYLVWQDYSDPQFSNGSVFTLNYRTSDGGEISFDEVVTDKAGFAGFVEEYISGGAEDPYTADSAKALAEKIMDPEEKIDFLIGYDAIYLIYQEEESSHFYDLFKIPAMYAGDYLDVSYFGTTPEYFILDSDIYDRITWDIDDDGNMDVITLEFERDEYDNIMAANIVINGEKKTPIPGTEIEEDLISCLGLKLLRTDNSFYAYVELSAEECDPCVYVFHFDSVEFQYEGMFTGYLDITHSYSPDRIAIHTRTDIFGTGLMKSTCSVLGRNGMPQKVEPFASKDGLAVLNKDYATTQVDKDGFPTGAVTIPAETTVRIVGIDLDNDWVLCSTVEEDETKNIYFILQVSLDSGSITYGVIDNILQDDMFSGLRYAG